jgi:hypothetical protein
MSARKQILIEQGATLSLSFQVLDDSTGDCLPKDLTGWTARMQIRETYQSASPLISLSSGSGISINATEGRVTVTASATQTAALPAPAALVYDIEGERTADGFVERWIRGTARVIPEVTR